MQNDKWGLIIMQAFFYIHTEVTSQLQADNKSVFAAFSNKHKRLSKQPWK